MAWQVVTSLAINGVETNWTYTDYGKQHIESFNQDGHSYNQPQAVNCDNPLCNLPMDYGSPNAFSVDLGGGLVITRDNSTQIIVYINGEAAFRLSSYQNFTNGRTGYHWVSFVINETEQRGAICIYSYFLQGGGSVYPYAGGGFIYWRDSERSSDYRGIYNWIKSQVPITYNWQSVPSISGKNGILSLVTLDSESINDGEPVSGAAVSVFDQAPSNDNNIKNLADTYGGGEASSAVDVTVKYKVTLPPGGSFSVLKLVAKKDSIPEDVSDGDKIVDISPSKTKKTVTGLDENSLYYFKIFAEDTNSNTSESDEKHITTSGDEGWSFDYTGEIQTFTAPKTGIYQLETWGAQGGNATDGTNTARGGYGAYAVGEVFLTQGDTLYINVGGQNGYGGGGINE